MDSALITGIAVIGLLLCTAFFSAVETALTVASQPLFHQMEKRGDRRANVKLEPGDVIIIPESAF